MEKCQNYNIFPKKKILVIILTKEMGQSVLFMVNFIRALGIIFEKNLYFSLTTNLSTSKAHRVFSRSTKEFKNNNNFKIANIFFC